MAFRALVTRKDESGKVASAIEEVDEAQLPEGDVLVGVEWAGFNYKDGLVLTGQGGLVRDYPHIGGVDFAGRVIESRDGRYHPGQGVILTGWRVGEIHWGGFATRARVKADWLVPLPRTLTARDAMVLGTAGLTAMLAVNRLKAEGVKPGDGPILVTGAGGGVGSIATLLLAQLGYKAHAMTGRPELAETLTRLGAAEIVGREVLAATGKKLLTPRWAGAIDSVGGPPLGELLKQVRPGGIVTAIGLAAGDGWDASVVPFILRGITLAGIDSVMQPSAARVGAWERLTSLFSPKVYDEMIEDAQLEDLPRLAGEILAGRIRGRVVVKTSS
ncbi:MDR family oxidoreductase [Pelagibacterium xiamenense]|uniref:MDR family oxidoreductase n=1 Tax=Pelagibacterium xiamenense TaxID=2901140 RepID=UPI001E490867|nr:MDR family oxidoreductase [Pelagibacterium xiamenense]MCD7060339.1 oxidoreductase [Pelagibacterium xiamenense]